MGGVQILVFVSSWLNGAQFPWSSFVIAWLCRMGCYCSDQVQQRFFCSGFLGKKRVYLSPLYFILFIYFTMHFILVNKSLL